MTKTTAANSIPEASEALAQLVPSEFTLSTGRILPVHKVKWQHLPGLLAEFGQQVSAVFAAWSAPGQPNVPWAELGANGAAFIERVIGLSCDIGPSELKSLDLDWDEVALLFLTAVNVNFAKGKDIRDLFNSALSALQSDSPSSQSATESDQQSEDDR